MFLKYFIVSLLLNVILASAPPNPENTLDSPWSKKGSLSQSPILGSRGNGLGEY